MYLSKRIKTGLITNTTPALLLLWKLIAREFWELTAFLLSVCLGGKHSLMIYVDVFVCITAAHSHTNPQLVTERHIRTRPSGQLLRHRCPGQMFMMMMMMIIAAWIYDSPFSACPIWAASRERERERYQGLSRSFTASADPLLHFHNTLA